MIEPAPPAPAVTMFIELAEFLRCPEGHEPDPYLVLVRDEMVGRHVVQGSVACPTCRREYPIADGAAEFGGARPVPPTVVELPDAEVIQALLGLGGPGGYVVLVGSAAALATGLAERMGGIHFVGVNPAADLEPAPVLSVLRHPSVLPLKTSMARGVVVGGELGGAWLAESERVLLRGLRLVVLREQVTDAPGVSELAVGKGMWVGEKK